MNYAFMQSLDRSLRYDGGKNPVSKAYIVPLYDALENTNYNDKELNSGCQGSGWGRMRLKRNSTKEVLGVMKSKICILIVMVIIEIYGMC